MHPKRTSVAAIYARHTRKYWLLFVAIVIGTAVGQAIMLAVPAYLRAFIDALVAGNEGAIGGILSTIVVLWCVQWVVQRMRYFGTIHLEFRAMSDILHDSFKYLIDHSYNFFVSHFAGSLTHKVTRFSRAYETLFDTVMLNFFPAFLFVGGAIVVLCMRNIVLGLILAGWVVGFLIFQIYVARLRQPARVRRAAADTKVTANLADTISNQATVALFSGSAHELSRFSSTVEEWKEATRRSWSADAWIWAGIGIFIIAIEVVLLYGGVHYWRLGLFTIGDFVLVQAYLFGAFERLEAVNRELRRVAEAYSDADEMVGILNTLHEVRDIPGAKALHVSKGAISFTDIDFHFHEEKAVFNNFNLSIKGGEKIALVGPSGAGKTTVTKLVLRLFDVQKGVIQIDDQNIAQVTQESLRNAIGFVPQEPVLFHRSLMENIRYGRRDATDEEVIEAARKAHCDEFISRLPDGYATFVGERGVKLSGGERQRVAIARAILKNAPILILDEATSSLDSASEVLIQDALARLMNGKTVIVIAHRLSTIMKMDRIIALKNGRIVEEGTHQELLGKKGLYASLWQHQAGGFIQDEDDGAETEVPKSDT